MTGAQWEALGVITAIIALISATYWSRRQANEATKELQEQRFQGRLDTATRALKDEHARELAARDRELADRDREAAQFQREIDRRDQTITQLTQRVYQIEDQLRGRGNVTP